MIHHILFEGVNIPHFTEISEDAVFKPSVSSSHMNTLSGAFQRITFVVDFLGFLKPSVVPGSTDPTFCPQKSFASSLLRY